MPSHLKKLVRARMEKTGESYEQALRHVRAQHGEPTASVPSPSRPSVLADTAFSVAAVRAEERARPLSERLFDDPYAHLYAKAGVHVADATNRFLELPFFRDGIRLRTRYIDDVVREGVANGIEQLVILGAGFDSRALRIAEIAKKGVSTYEVDSSAQLQRKREVLRTAGVKSSAVIKYVGCDFDSPAFETQLTASLVASGFRLGAGALFVWEGVIGFIDMPTIDRNLQWMAAIGGKRSCLVFTYAENTFEPVTAAEHTLRAGFDACMETAGDELWRRYLTTEPHPNAFVMKIGVARIS